MQKKVSLILIVVFLSVVLGLAGLAFASEGAIMDGEKKEAEREPTAEEIEMERLRRLGLEEAKKVVAAKVNDAPITMHSVVMMMNRIGAREGMDVEAVKKEAINRLIIQELAYQKAKAEGINIEDDKIDNSIANFIENLGGEKAFKDFLHREVLTEEEIRENARRSLMIEIVLAREVLEKTNVPEDALKEEYENLKDRLIFPEKIIVTDVYFLKADNKSMKKAQSILKKIKADKDKDPWKLVLDGTFIVRDMEIKKDKNKELYDAAKKLKIGQLSNIIKTPASLHIIKLKSYSPEKQATLDEIRGWLENRLKAPYQQKRQQEWEQELKKDAKIEIIEADKK
jgi:parvulin-like peptidyl-prolyl isomerase